MRESARLVHLTVRLALLLTTVPAALTPPSLLEVVSALSALTLALLVTPLEPALPVSAVSTSLTGDARGAARLVLPLEMVYALASQEL